MARSKATGARGWWVNETAPDLRDVLPSRLNADEFTAWLGPMLGAYRNTINERAAVGPAAEEIAHVRRVRQALRELPALLAEFPLRIEAELTAASWRRRELPNTDWCELVRQIERDCVTLRVLLGDAVRALSGRAATPGRKRATPRDVLLSAIVTKLRQSMNAPDARLIAEQILVRCQIVVPRGERAVRRASHRASGQK